MHHPNSVLARHEKELTSLLNKLKRDCHAAQEELMKIGWADDEKIRNQVERVAIELNSIDDTLRRISG